MTTPMPRRAAVLAASVLAVTLVAGCTFFEDDYTPQIMAIPSETDIAYGPLQGCGVTSPATDEECGGSQELDIYRSEVSGPNPVAVWVHGGGFVGGDKGHGVNEYFGNLLDEGWDIVAVNYRVATKDGHNQFPVPLQDVKRAVRWIKANAADQDWDPQQIAAIGHSAGGNLAGMLATTANDAGLEPTDLPPELQAVDSSVVAAVSLHGTTDVATYAASVWGEPANTYVGCAECPERQRLASVQTYVDAESAPLLAIYGANDGIAPPDQGDLLSVAYAEAGVEDRFQLIVVDDGPEKFQAHEPDVKRYADEILDFILDGADEVV